MSYQQKYLKYKYKYLALRRQFGGACVPAPPPADPEHISMALYRDIPENKLISIGQHCFDLIGLVQWIRSVPFNAEDPYTNPRNAATNVPMTYPDIWKIIRAYNDYIVANPIPVAAEALVAAAEAQGQVEEDEQPVQNLPPAFVYTAQQSDRINAVIDTPDIPNDIKNLIKWHKKK